MAILISYDSLFFIKRFYCIGFFLLHRNYFRRSVLCVLVSIFCTFPKLVMRCSLFVLNMRVPGSEVSGILFVEILSPWGDSVVSVLCCTCAYEYALRVLYERIWDVTKSHYFKPKYRQLHVQTLDVCIHTAYVLYCMHMHIVYAHTHAAYSTCMSL